MKRDPVLLITHFVKNQFLKWEDKATHSKKWLQKKFCEFSNNPNDSWENTLSATLKLKSASLYLMFAKQNIINVR